MILEKSILWSLKSNKYLSDLFLKLPLPPECISLEEIQQYSPAYLEW